MFRYVRTCHEMYALPGGYRYIDIAEGRWVMHASIGLFVFVFVFFLVCFYFLLMIIIVTPDADIACCIIIRIMYSTGNTTAEFAAKPNAIDRNGQTPAFPRRVHVGPCGLEYLYAFLAHEAVQGVDVQRVQRMCEGGWAECFCFCFCFRLCFFGCAVVACCSSSCCCLL